MTMQAHMTSIVADSLHSAVQKVSLKVYCNKEME